MPSSSPVSSEPTPVSPGPTAVRSGPIRPTAASHYVLQPVAYGAITGGLWAERRRINREVSIPEAWDRLHEASNFHNLELAAGRAEGAYVNDLPFLDSDIYKWLEAVGWVLTDPELTPPLAERLRDQLASTADLLAAAQQPDGYLDSHFQVRFPGERFVQLAWGHELYCAGHLIQAAVAVQRAGGDPALFAVARRVADLVVDSFGTEQGRIDGICGHPEIETALVELYRETGDERYLARATYFIDRHGHGLLPEGRFGRQYWQDHTPVREADAVTGHAVRQLYLLAGVADVYAETGDASLRDAAERLWAEMVATKTYLTGGVGSHHTDEAFGDPYELPSERSYCETCAAIASIMFSARMLMITGEARYADLLERTLYNGFLAGTSLDGQSYIYANPLQVRDDHVRIGGDQDYARVPWFQCACCPPNVMRLLASLEHYVALSTRAGVALHQYLTGRWTAALADGDVVLEVTTDYPWDGTVRVGVTDGPSSPWELALRVPAWAEAGSVSVSVDGVPVDVEIAHGWLRLTRSWPAGTVIELVLPLDVRFTVPDPRVDAIRGSAAVERGPLVYCLEGVDHPDVRLDDVVLEPAGPVVDPARSASLGDAVTLRLEGHRRPHAAGWWPYGSTGSAVRDQDDATPIPLVAVPYFTWGNREPGAMRVWIPTS